MLSIEKQKIILDALSPFEPTYIGLFGSYVRGEERADSDVDVLVSFGIQPDFFELIAVEDYISEQLGIKVDLVTEHALHPLVREAIQDDLRQIA